MELDPLINSINEMVTSVLVLDSRVLDVMTAGKFLNKLDRIIEEAAVVPSLQKAARDLSKFLERIIIDYDSIKDHEAVFAGFEKGVGSLQIMANQVKKEGDSVLPGPPADVDGRNEIPADSGQAQEALAGQLRQEEMDRMNQDGEANQSFLQDDSLLKDFIVEALEYINEIEVNILNLEQNPDNKEHVNAVFRPFHSIKGVAGFLNLEKIRDLAHSLENALDKVRNDEWPVSSMLIDIILDGADALKEMIGNLRNRMDGREEEPLRVDISALEMRLKKLEEDPSGQGTVGESNVKKIGEILVEDGVIREETLEMALKEASRSVPPRKIGETLIEDGKVTPKQVSQALRKQASQITDATSIRVDTRKLDDLVNMVGELVITQTMIRQSPIVQGNKERKLFRDISQLVTITSELQRLSTSLRMIPIKQTFQRMSRLVRDLSRAAGKTINIELEGEDTEIDRNMVEEIYNPLVHLIRNAVDHGIESPRERIDCGKPEAGLITLKAYHRGGYVVIEIADNGRGLNKGKILDKAIRNRLVDPQESLSDADIFRLIFLPGLSTADKITDVSGRGVGMDVVKKAIEKLRGKIEIETIEGRGTTFITSFPLTMAIIDGMIVRVGRERYIIPTTAIRQLLRPTRESYNSVINKGEMINVRGNLLPLVRLYDLFDIEPEHKEPWESIVVVVDGESRSKCLLVDEIIGKEEVVIKGLGEGLKMVKGVSGGAIMGDGSVGLILDPEGLFELSEEKAA
ncbi:MAG: chemotaxis protein CheA [Syntrophales bacterium]